ncbi:agamous-like MADS-box protein AGL61 [Lycium barbarum]|uniref:agamous-like MADS-box protein AGL61 n=1 Tax=Lycium barbarum TaxID=112863 RepID=UPI00293F33CD|nr:agamous-like MADS-box protein AGL61 [Lycium barbarum]
MADKKPLGRQKIPMAKIENKDARYATFSKRREGLYKTASKLIGQYDLDIGIIISSPTSKPYSFFHPTVDAVIDRYLNPNTLPSESNRLAAENSRNKVKELIVKLDEYDITENDETDEKIWLKSIDESLRNRLMQLEKGASTSAQSPPYDAN